MTASQTPRDGLPIGGRTTAAELRNAGYHPLSPGERLRDRVLQRLAAASAKGATREDAFTNLYAHTVLSPQTYEDLTAALLSSAHVLFFGPSGAGKTSLAKDVWELFPKEVWAVEGCPVLDDPLNLIDSANAERFPPCPICRRRFAPGNDGARFDPEQVDAKQVPAVLVQLREGYGFARLQGSSEVFPDHLTGNINLRKLEEIGDPMSPLVLEPGKLLQANRGLLLVDEIGKLPLGTQNVLLQALQEGTVTPSKTRETFPATFVAICTSNLSDLDNINDPLSDRLTSLHVGYNPHHADNRRIVAVGRSEALSTYVPEVLIDAGVRLIESWRLRNPEDNPDVGEVGSNRTLLDMVARTGAVALLAGRAVPGPEDLRGGLLHAMRGRIRARSGESFQQNEKRVREFIESYLDPALKRSSGTFWCRYFRGRLREDKAEGEATVSEGRRLKDDPALVDQMRENATLFPRFRAFSAYVGEMEHPPESVGAVGAAVHEFELLERFSLFSCPEDDDDAPL